MKARHFIPSNLTQRILQVLIVGYGCFLICDAIKNYLTNTEKFYITGLLDIMLGLFFTIGGIYNFIKLSPKKNKSLLK